MLSWGGRAGHDGARAAHGSNRVPWRSNERIRLGALLAGLAVLVFYLLAVRVGGLGADANPSPSGGAWAAGCPARDAPRVASVPLAHIAELKASVSWVGVVGPYEAGTIGSENAWSDNSPLPVPPPSPGAHRPAAYEMRWWAPNRDDIVADVFVFDRARRARDFFERASSARCRPAGVQAPVSGPPNAQDLVWLNPEGLFQEDVYLLRGDRVYRVGDVRPQRRGVTPRGVEQRIAFLLVNGLACALPGAGCPSGAGLGAAPATFGQPV